MKQAITQAKGVMFGIGAYLIWGILPVYWKLIDQVSPYQILAHRIIWSFILMLCILVATKKLYPCYQEIKAIIATPKKILVITIASIVISANWCTYIWAVNSHRVVEASLGYYINPLISVLLAIIFLREKLSLWQVVSFLLATIGVLNLVLQFGAVPWAALTLAITFAFYALVKKIVKVSTVTGITLETMIVTPVALIYLAYLHQQGNGVFGQELFTTLGLMGTGIVTAVPLLLFAAGAKHLTLTLLGFMQYIAPTIALALGVLIYHEPFTKTHQLSFTFIWLALTIFSLARTKWFTQWEQALRQTTLKVLKARR